ncbi:MAG: HDIG domain-containing protein [Prevotellaceae bacterium]|nr:HDIG domain-containing protein [Prevotellaceae bacterium]MDO4931129.1 HDIG domain-containing protein [Prevotellaceae bacterium]
MAMENVTTSKLSSVRSFMATIGIMCLCVTVIVLMMPNSERPRLTYTINEPWVNPQLISPGQILIMKDPKVVEQEQQAALRNEYMPYYTRNDATGQRQTSLFLEMYGKGQPGISAYTMQLVANAMTAIYHRGIMQQTDYMQIFTEDSMYSFMLVNEKQAARTYIKDVYSAKQAYEALFADKRLEKYREELRKCNLNEFLVPNISYDERRSEQAKYDIVSMVPTNSGVMKQGQEIINRGEIVTEEKARMIDSYNEFISTESQKGAYELLRTNGIQWLYVMTLMMLFVMYMQFFRRDYLDKPRSMAMVFTLITLFPMMNALMMRFDPRSVFILPLCIVPMFVRVFLDSRTAFMAHTVMVLICAAAVSEKFEFIVVQVSAGFVAICALRELSRRSQIFSTALIVAISGMFVYTVLKFLDNKDMTFEALKHPYFTFMCNGVLLLLTYPMMFIVEKAFGFISSVTLFELSDTNRDILRKLAEVAPGTFQHSIMVSNLATAIATEVGAKSQLVRTGAFYHDIGKISNPVFFTENQVGVNPHTRLEPKESAKIIIDHVTEGVRLAEKNGVPDVISNFILTHHGRGLAKFFYTTYKNEHPDEEIDETPFRYPGPNPFSREQAILMMADSVEAASRSLPEYTEESISNLVNRIIDSQVAEGFFQECPITFRDIATAKRVLIERLKSIYHTRIQYPELNETKDAGKEEKE